MGSQVICATLHGNIDGASNVKDRVQTAVENACDELNSFSSEHTYYSVGPKDAEYFPSPSAGDGEDQFLTNFGHKLAEGHNQNEVYVQGGDIWIIVDVKDEWGYGRGRHRVTVDLNGTDYYLWVGRALALEKSWAAPDPNEMTKKLVKHNIGHCLTGKHWQGRYTVDENDEIADVTPMANSYLRAASGDSATCGRGQGEVPDEFDKFRRSEKYGTLPNKSDLDKSYAGSCQDLIVHDFDYNYEAKQKLEEGTPRPVSPN